jgi:hypothetical protein
MASTTSAEHFNADHKWTLPSPPAFHSYERLPRIEPTGL